MKNIKYIIGVLVIITGIVFAYFNFVVNPTNANPDYICVKSVDRSCKTDESKCSNWQTDGTRICDGKRVTEVGYYHTRTSCESGYTKTKTGRTASSNTAARFAEENSLDSEGKSANKKHPSSGRHSTDFVYATENCSIKQIDKNRPSGEVEQIN